MLLIFNNNRHNEESQVLSKISNPKKKSSSLNSNSEEFSSQPDFFKGIIRVLNQSNHPLNFTVSFQVFLQRISYLKANRSLDYETKETVFDSYQATTPDEEEFEKILQEIVKMFKIDGRKLIISLLYLENFLKNSGLKLNDYNLIKLIITSLVITGKFYDDLFDIDMKSIYKNFKFDSSEFQKMEMSFFEGLDYKLDIQTKELSIFTRKIATSMINKLKNNN